MTAQALAGAFAGITLALLIVVGLLAHRLRTLAGAHAAARETEQTYHRELELQVRERLEQARAALAQRQAELGALGIRLDGAEARQLEADRRRAELEAELEEERASPLVGKVVVANTPAPDDQSVRGVVTRELHDGRGLLLAGAVYLENAPGRGDVQERPAGDVVVHRVSWTQVLPPEE